MGYTLAYAHQGWIWYLIGGAALYYLVYTSWRNLRHELLGRYMIWAAACFIGIAWLFGGTVSRYILPFMPVFVAGALYSLLNDRHRQSFCRFYAVYIVSLAIALTASYFFR